MDFDFYSASYTFVPLAPSHEMRYRPFLGSLNPETQNMRKREGRGVENGKYEREWYNNPSRRPPSSNHFPEGDPLTRKPR